MAKIFKKFVQKENAPPEGAMEDLGPPVVNIMSCNSLNSTGTTESIPASRQGSASHAMGQKRSWLPTPVVSKWFKGLGRKKKAAQSEAPMGDADEAMAAIMAPTVKMTVCIHCEKESAEGFLFCGFCGLAKDGSDDSEPSRAAPKGARRFEADRRSSTASRKAASFDVDWDNADTDDMTMEQKVLTAKSKQRRLTLTMPLPPDAQETSCNTDLGAHIHVHDSAELNTIKAFIGKVLAVPSISKLKSEFIDNYLEGKEVSLTNRNQAHRDIWKFHDLLLAEGWTIANGLLEEKLRGLEVRDAQLKESEEKTDRLKAHCLKEMTILRDKQLQRDFNTLDKALVDPLPYLSESTQELVKNCADEMLRHMLDMAGRGDTGGRAYEIIRDGLTKERNMLEALVEKHKLELQEELPQLRLAEASLKNELEEARVRVDQKCSELVELHAVLSDLQEQHEHQTEELQTLREQAPLSPAAAKPGCPMALLGDLCESLPGVHILGLPPTLANPLDDPGTTKQAAGGEEGAADIDGEQAADGKEANALDHQEESALHAFLPAAVLDYLHRVGAVVDFQSREAVFKTISVGRIIRLGDGTSPVVINVAEQGANRFDDGECSPLDLFRGPTSWNGNITLQMHSSDGESRPILPGATSSALMHHATKVHAEVEEQFGGKGVDLLYALQRLGEQLDVEVLHDAEEMCQPAKCDTYPFMVLLIERIHSARSESVVLTKFCIALVQSLSELSKAATVVCPPAQKVKFLIQRIAEVFSANHPNLVKYFGMAQKAWMHMDVQREHLKPKEEDVGGTAQSRRLSNERPGSVVSLDSSFSMFSGKDVFGSDHADTQTDAQSTNRSEERRGSGKVVDHVAEERRGSGKVAQLGLSVQAPPTRVQEHATAPSPSPTPKARSLISSMIPPSPKSRSQAGSHDDQHNHKVNLGVQLDPSENGPAHNGLARSSSAQRTSLMRKHTQPLPKQATSTELEEPRTPRTGPSNTHRPPPIRKAVTQHETELDKSSPAPFKRSSLQGGCLTSTMHAKAGPLRKQNTSNELDRASPAPPKRSSLIGGDPDPPLLAKASPFKKSSTTQGKASGVHMPPLGLGSNNRERMSLPCSSPTLAAKGLNVVKGGLI